MTGKTLDSYFTPSSSRSTKRPRQYTSPSSGEETPASTMVDEKVGDLTRCQLMAALGSLLDEKLSTIATKEDLSEITVKVTVLEEENKVLKEEVSKSKIREKLICDKLVDLEGRSRRNNLIFKGLNIPENTKDYRGAVRKFCIEVFGCRDNLWINRAHTLGRDRKSVIAHLPDDADIDYIMSRVKTLKGTGYVVHRDFPQEVREKRYFLLAVRSEVQRVAGRSRIPLVHDHLLVEGCRFTWESGRLMAGQQDGADRLSTLFKHDFTTFLASLKQGEAARHPPRTYSEALRTEAANTFDNLASC